MKYMGNILRAFAFNELELEPATEYDSEETKAAREKADRLEDLFLETLFDLLS